MGGARLDILEALEALEALDRIVTIVISEEPEQAERREPPRVVPLEREQERLVWELQLASPLEQEPPQVAQQV